jgi:hypothetical protein
MTNNAVENYLFAGSDSGGARAAAMYTLTETAKMNGVNPEGYVRDVIARIADHRSIASTNCYPGIGGRAADKLPKGALRFASTIALRQTSSSRDALRVPVNLPINEQASHGWRQRGRRSSPDAYIRSAYAFEHLRRELKARARAARYPYP